MNPIQNNTIFHAAWKSVPDFTLPTRAFDQIANLKIESVFIIFLGWYIVHKRKIRVKK
jgi:hypothetical protein